MEFSYAAVVRGYHVYRVYWKPFVGESLLVDVDDPVGRRKDRYCIRVKRGNITVGHLPKEISRECFHFLLHGGDIRVEVTGRPKKSSLRQGGREVPCVLIFSIKNPNLLERMKDLLTSVTGCW